MNILTGAAVCVIALGLYARQLPPIKSTTAKVYGITVGFGVFSMAFPMGLHWSFIMIGTILQAVAVVCCIIAAHDYRTSRVMQTVKKDCRKLRRQMESDAVSDCWIYISGMRAGERRRLEK